jgi:hypothetical protein
MRSSPKRPRQWGDAGSSPRSPIPPRTPRVNGTAPRHEHLRFPANSRPEQIRRLAGWFWPGHRGHNREAAPANVPCCRPGVAAARWLPRHDFVMAQHPTVAALDPQSIGAQCYKLRPFLTFDFEFAGFYLRSTIRRVRCQDTIRRPSSAMWQNPVLPGREAARPYWSWA